MGGEPAGTALQGANRESMKKIKSKKESELRKEEEAREKEAAAAVAQD